MLYTMYIIPGLYLSKRSQMERRAYGSTPAVGSSRMTTRDPAVNAMAIDSFRCIPPDESQAGNVNHNCSPNVNVVQFGD